MWFSSHWVYDSLYHYQNHYLLFFAQNSHKLSSFHLCWVQMCRMIDFLKWGGVWKGGGGEGNFWGFTKLPITLCCWSTDLVGLKDGTIVKTWFLLLYTVSSWPGLKTTPIWRNCRDKTPVSLVSSIWRLFGRQINRKSTETTMSGARGKPELMIEPLVWRRRLVWRQRRSVSFRRRSVSWRRRSVSCRRSVSVQQ